ncbi:hypothetical protein LVJ94_25940 [Pendulispora rubella]|uniref:Uncharacterized protein n=1 Tax=Pendulispora rubella TaxID=2741070 RepID=A0ABZ2LIA2_9BACT
MIFVFRADDFEIQMHWLLIDAPSSPSPNGTTCGFDDDDEGASFRFESDDALGAAAFSNAFRKNAALFVAVQRKKAGLGAGEHRAWSFLPFVSLATSKREFASVCIAPTLHLITIQR